MDVLHETLLRQHCRILDEEVHTHVHVFFTNLDDGFPPLSSQILTSRGSFCTLRHGLPAIASSVWHAFYCSLYHQSLSLEIWLSRYRHSLSWVFVYKPVYKVKKKWTHDTRRHFECITFYILSGVGHFVLNTNRKDWHVGLLLNDSCKDIIKHYEDKLTLSNIKSNTNLFCGHTEGNWGRYFALDWFDKVT